MIKVICDYNRTYEKEIASYLYTGDCDFYHSLEHDPRWLNVLSQGLGHRPFVLIAFEHELDSSDSHIVGYLPLMLVTSKLFGRFLVSLPFLNSAGVIADTTEIEQNLITRAAKLTQQLNADYLELRHQQNPIAHPCLNQTRDEKYRMILDLPDSPDALWKQVNAKVRNLVRKGEKHNLAISFGRHELLEDFYNIFAINMRDLGTPVYPRKLFSLTLDSFPDHAELAIVKYQSKPVAAALLIHDNQSTQVPSASALRKFNHTSANMWMYHQLLLRAIKHNSPTFDFGRSSEDSGTYRFKKQWGAKPQPTVWQYYVRRGDINSARPESPKYKRKIEIWQKLPVWVTKMVGPTIVRGIP